MATRQNKSLVYLLILLQQLLQLLFKRIITQYAISSMF